MSATAKLTTLGVLAITLAGCASPDPTPTSPSDTAWTTCVAFYDEHEPDGIVHAETGERYDSDRICHNMIGTRGQEHFDAFWNDPESVEDYARGF